MRLAVLGCLLALAGCGGGGPDRVLDASRTLSGLVFYDENGNGRLDAGEEVRLPDVVLRLGSLTATSGPGGTFALSGAPAGAQSIEAQPESLPPFFQAVSLPLAGASASTLAVPLPLPIGTNRPNVYMAFGDSITTGQGSEDSRGYLGPLGDRLTRYWGRAVVVNEGAGGTTSDQGAIRVGDALSRERPAYTLIDYGTNDYSHACRKTGECSTIANLRSMVQEARRRGSLPVLATLLPGNAPEPALDQARDRWVRETNAAIRDLAREEGAAVADPFTLFDQEPDPRRLFADALHPNDRGYQLVADAFFFAITRRSR